MSNAEIPDFRATEVVMGNAERPMGNTDAIPQHQERGTDTINPATNFQNDHPNAERSSHSLWSLTQNQTEHALNCGALQSIQTDYEFVEQNGVQFLVRILSNLARKEKANKKQQQLKKKGHDFNPFLPYEKDLFVCNLSSTHLCLLNKFNVVNHHLLIITREFEEQETWLNLDDFYAVWSGLQEIDGLVFYNGGKLAGASQRHKHIQLIPMPLSPEGLAIPMEALFRQQSSHEYEIAALPFKHGFSPLNLSPPISPLDAAHILLDCYQMLLHQLERKHAIVRDRNFIPYNLLITRRWMFLVPRIQENAYSISINSLGFAGSLFVKNEMQLDLLKEKGPMSLLQSVGYTLSSYS